jgi:hypothetical protein
MRTPCLRLPFAFAALLVAACTPGAYMGDDSGDDDSPPPPTPDAGNGVTQVAGDITADATWSGDVAVSDVTIKSGATVTIAAGAHLTFAANAGIVIEGALLVQGADGQLVTFDTAGTAWSGLYVAAGGSLDLKYASLTKAATAIECTTGAAACLIDHATIDGNNRSLQLNAPATITRSTISRSAGNSVNLGAGADVTITDTVMRASGGDLLIMSGGKVHVDYSTIGEVVDSYEHCGLHINSAESLIIEHSEIHSNVYGGMIGGTSGARINYSNWRENSTDIDPIGTNTAFDLRFNYWDKTPPAAIGDVSDASATPLVVGPRP